MNITQTNLSKLRAYQKLAGARLCVTFLMAAVFLIGCQKTDSNFQDPLLRQQLTTMVSDLRADRAVPKATSDLRAILAVNSVKLSTLQKTKLETAMNKLQRMTTSLKIWREAQSQPGYTEAKGDAIVGDYGMLLKEAKELISEAAGTF